MLNLILDTGPLVAVLNRDDNHFLTCSEFLKSFRGIFLSTEAVLTEALYLLGPAFEQQKKCFEFVLSAVKLIPPNSIRLKRVLSLMDKYQDVPMDYADASLVSLAEETEIGEIFTLDHRGFEIYRWNRRKPFTIFP